MSAAPSSGVEQTAASWPHARNRRARRKAATADQAIEFPTTFAGWARATREVRAAFWERWRTIPPELLTAREASERIEKLRTVARDRGEELELPLSHEELARAHEARDRTTPWLARPVLDPLIQRLSRLELGYSNATEFTLRGMAWVDTGHVYGEHTFARYLRAADAAGEIKREYIPRGRRFKNGELTIGGTTTNRFRSDKERAELRWKERIAKRAQRRQRARAEKLIRREPAAPETPARARTVDEPRTALPQVLSESILRQDFLKPPPGAEPIGVAVAADDWEAKKARALELAAQWTAAERDERPPPE